MTPALKIVFGALATILLAWWLHGPMEFGKKCAAAAGLSGTAAVAPVTPAATDAVPAAIETPASVEAVANCQQTVEGLMAGKTVQFASGGAAIAPVSKELLDSLGASLKDCAGTTVEVAGHTDRTGDAGKNMTLSQARANAVVASLVERGVPAERLVAKGYGETMPTDASAPENNAADRRIQFSVAATAAAPAAN